MRLYERSEGDLKLTKPIKEIEAPGCRFRLIDDGDGIIIRFIPEGVDEKLAEIAACVPRVNPGGQFVGCRKVTCGKKCCPVEQDDGSWGCSCQEECEEDDDS